MHINLIHLLLLTLAPIITLGHKEVEYNLTISYFSGTPDGVPKQILGVNGQFPAPTLRAELNDILTIHVTNNIQDGQTTTLHWHGIEQYLTPWEDGPRMLMQCDIPPNSSYTYRFQVHQSGTYWYHAHHTGQYGEGLWGILIIDNVPEVHEYDGEFLIAVSDWFHIPSLQLSAWYQNTSVSRGGMPYPDSSLINGGGYYPCEYAALKNMSCDPSYKERYQLFEVEKGKTYRFRVANPATIVLYVLSIDGHKLETIETDGVDTVRVAPADRVTISTGTRYSFLVKMDGDLDQYWIRSWADLSTFKRDYPNINPFPEAQFDNPTTLAVLRYKQPTEEKVKVDKRQQSSNNKGAIKKQGRPENHDGIVSLLEETPSMPKVNGFEYYSDDPMILPLATPPFPNTTEEENPVTLNYMDCIPYFDEVAPTYVNQSIVLYIPHIDDPLNTHKPGFNNISYDVSTLDKPAFIKMLNDETLPESLNPIEIEGFGYDYVVELIINDYGDSGHPFHLHGHTFWVMGYGALHDGPFVEDRDRSKLRSGVRKETMAVLFDSWVVLRFRANSPGLWLLHCHMNFHFEAAIGLVFLEGKEVAKRMFKDKEPSKVRELCKASGIEWEMPLQTTEAPSSSQRLFYSSVLLVFIQFLIKCMY